MRLWIDDVRPAPEGYIWAKTVLKAEWWIMNYEATYRATADKKYKVELIDIDHDAGEFGPPDYIKLLDWLEETGRNYPIRIHSMNPVGVANMRAIIERNGWKEVK